MTEMQTPAELLIPRMAELEAENERLRKILAELLLTNQVLREKNGPAFDHKSYRPMYR